MDQAPADGTTDLGLETLLDHLDTLLSMTGEWLQAEDGVEASLLVLALSDCKTALDEHPSAEAIRHRRLPWQLSVLVREIDMLGRHRARLCRHLLPPIRAELDHLESTLSLPPHPGGSGRDTLPDRLERVCDRLSDCMNLSPMRRLLMDQAKELRLLQQAERQLKCGALQPVHGLLRQLRAGSRPAHAAVA